MVMSCVEESVQTFLHEDTYTMKEHIHGLLRMHLNASLSLEGQVAEFVTNAFPQLSLIHQVQPFLEKADPW